MPPILKFQEITLASEWTQLSGRWSQRDTALHHDGDTTPNSFNFFANHTDLRDGAVEAIVRISAGQDPTGRLLFRRSSRGCYYAGIGGCGAHFIISKFIQTAPFAGSIPLATAGSANDICLGEPYALRVEFVGERIVLKKGGLTVLEATDDWFLGPGNVGCNCYADSVVEFGQYRAFEVPPVAPLVRILETFPYLLKRDYAYLKRALENEKDVQRILWTVLRSHYPDLIDEEYLGRFGIKHYKNDFGIASLKTIIEVKVVGPSTSLKQLQEDLMVDAVGYFATSTSFKYLVCFIYNMENQELDSSFETALLSLPHVAAVVIVPGVSFS